MLFEDDLAPMVDDTLIRMLKRVKRTKERTAPTIITQPFRKIPCREIADDFYSNLIDWSGNHIYYSVNDSVFGYNFYSGSIEILFHSPDSSITSLKHCISRNTLCVGTAGGTISFIDLCSLKYAKYLYHRGRIGAIEVFGNQIVTGSRDRRSKIIDLRTLTAAATFSSHIQEVCGLSINNNHKYLASGGNDNKISVYDLRDISHPLMKFSEHTAAVRALCWSPRSQSELVSGGGTADKTIKHWDILKTVGKNLIQSYAFDSQVCNLKWLRNNKILSTFGYSNDDIKLLEGFKPTRIYTGHKNRVIHFSVDESENYFVSGSSDSKLRVWEIERDKETAEIKLR